MEYMFTLIDKLKACGSKLEQTNQIVSTITKRSGFFLGNTENVDILVQSVLPIDNYLKFLTL